MPHVGKQRRIPATLKRLNSILANARVAGLQVLGACRDLGAPLGLALMLLSIHPAAAQTMLAEPSATSTLHVAVGKSAPFSLYGDVRRVVVAQPDIAKVDTAGPNSLYVIGREVGSTNLLVYGPDALLLQVVNIDVGYDGPQLSEELAAALPGEAITAEALSTGILLRGSVSNPEAAAVAEDLADRAAPGEVTTLIDVRPHQVMLEVKLIEASEEDLRDIGVDLSATGDHVSALTGAGLFGVDAPQSVIRGGGRVAGLDLDAALLSLERRGAVRILARPRLLALSGHKASFQSGGEFPYPVPSRDGVTIEFRSYGTSIAVLPTVQANGLIRLALSSEVSSVDSRNSIRIGAIAVPALSTRKVETTLEVRDGERFLFAGLFSDVEEDKASQTPWMADLPMVGGLFRANFVRSQRLQLAIIVTASVVEGSNVDVAKPVQPGDLLKSSADVIADTATPAPPPLVQPSARGLARLVQKSPVLSAVSHRLAPIAHAALSTTRNVWTTFERLSKRVLAVARGRAPLKPTVAALDS